MKIGVVGAGSWGTAMAAHLALSGHQVGIWAREPEVVSGINVERRNPLFLSDIELPTGMEAFAELSQALGGTQVVVMAVPSRWTREVAHDVAVSIPRKAVVLNLAKGFDYRTNRRLSETIAEELGREAGAGVAVLSGPNHAEEVARKVPSATVIASVDPGLSRSLQASFSSPYFRVYTNTDVVGVEVGGAYKNVIALAAGMLDGLGLGDNTKATLITRGLAEMARFGSALGANPITFSGLSGIGDLIVTCISRHSRNRGYGEKLGAGGSPAALLEESRMVVEGVFATRAVIAMANEIGVEVPIAMGVNAVLDEKASPADMLEKLMTRRLKGETEETLYRDFLLK
ncbi:MAG: NAD(P)-dependent glycerol-3-phosphate dehydrogenase [Actinobacteria bacterium]|nr:NAD(P)-dependent glycerol-3-phosphate dehydrogenase [Actinomycetota bacterium]